MASTRADGDRYWGTCLIRDDKSPAPALYQLLLGIAHYINKNITPWNTQCLTPDKLAHFYRLLGRNYDTLFLDTPPASLSFIFQSLGCYHSLQPSDDPYRSPCVPALTPHGFVRWQTMQLLLRPDEHAPVLQEAVKRFEIVNAADGRQFPPYLPRDVLPKRPDRELIEWHETVSQRLKLEAQAPSSTQPRLSPRTTMRLDRPHSRDTDSVESMSLVDMEHSRQWRPSSSHTSPTSRRSSRAAEAPALDPPWSPLRRRSSFPAPRSRQHRSGSTTSRPNHSRTNSTLSQSSYESDSSSDASSILSPNAKKTRNHLPRSHSAQHLHFGAHMPHHGAAGHLYKTTTAPVARPPPHSHWKPGNQGVKFNLEPEVLGHHGRRHHPLHHTHHTHHHQHFHPQQQHFHHKHQVPPPNQPARYPGMGSPTSPARHSVMMGGSPTSPPFAQSSYGIDPKATNGGGAGPFGALGEQLPSLPPPPPPPMGMSQHPWEVPIHPGVGKLGRTRSLQGARR